jgi:hypothetical protein
MNRDITPSLRSWLEETIDAAPAPTRLHQQVAAMVRRTPQQRRWLPSLYIRKSPGIARLAGTVVAAGAVLLFGGVLLTGVLRGQVAGPGPSASPTRSAPSFRIPFEYVMPPIGSLRLDHAPDERYLFGFVDDADKASPAPDSGLAQIRRGVSVAAVVDAWTHGCPDAAGTVRAERTPVREAPAELLEDLRTIAGISFGAATTTSLDGRPALMMAPDPATSRCDSGDLHVGGHIQGLSVDYVELMRPSRLILADVDGVTILVDVWARTADDLAAWLPIASTFVESIHFLDQAAQSAPPVP